MKELLLLFDGIHLEGGVGMAAFYAVFGFAFVAVGIALLIGILSLLGFVMSKIVARKKETKSADAPAPTPKKDEEGISPELVAVLTAAVAAAMEAEQRKCDFVVRRIKKI